MVFCPPSPPIPSTTLSFSQEVACSTDLQLHAPHWPEANKPHGKRLSHANREGGLCEDILVDKVVLVNHAGNAAWGNFSELKPVDFERSWRICAFGSFLCCQQAVPDMVSSGNGTILFTGATSAVRGRAGALAFSSAKFAVRGLAWSLAREVGPKGIHVAHIIIDGILDTSTVRSDMSPDAEEPLLNTDAVADVYWSLVEQHKSTWTFELDLRPHNEDFFS